MSRWGNWLKRSTLVMLGAVLIGSTAGVPVMASEPPAGTGEQADQTRITVMSFTGLSNEEMVRHVQPGCTEEEVLSQLPAKLNANVIVRAPQDTSRNNSTGVSDDSSVSDLQEKQEQGTPAEGAEGENAEQQDPGTGTAGNTAKAPGIGQKIMETGENHVLTPVPMMVPVTWKLSTADGYSSSGTFDSAEGTQYAYVPELAAADESGNLYEAEPTLYKDAEKIPAMHVLVLKQTSGEDSPANEAAPTVDGNNDGGAGGNLSYDSDKTHGLTISTETKDDQGNISLYKDNNFKITTGGTYGIRGEWERILDGDGKPVIAGKDPVILIEGPGDFTLVLQDGLKLDTTSNGTEKPLIRVTGKANVELVSQGGSMTCLGEGNSAYAALQVEAGSTVEIADGVAKDFEINGEIWNEGTLIIRKKTNAVKVNGAVVNSGKMRVGIFDEKGASGGSAGAWYPGKLDIGSKGYFLNMAGGELSIGNTSALTVDGSTTQGNGFTNSGDLKVVGNQSIVTVTGAPFENQSKIVIGGDSAGNGQLTANRSFINTGEIDVEKKGILQVDGLLTNSNRLSVKAWTIPEPANKEEDGGKLIVNSSSDGVLNTGTLELAEGGVLTSTGNNSVTVTNSGIFRIADPNEPKFLGENIHLKKGDDDTGEANAHFYMTNITDGLIEDLPEIAYTGENQYKDVWAKCDYKKTWRWTRDPGEEIDFEVIGSDWEHDIFLDPDGINSAGRTVEIPQTYYLVYYAKKGTQPTRRKTPVRKQFGMSPASVEIRCTNPSTTALDHPDLKARIEKGELTEEQIKDAVYELGSDMKVQVKMAVYSQRKDNSHTEKSLTVSVKDKKGNVILEDIFGHPMDGTSNDSLYDINFDSVGRATVLLNDIPTIPDEFITPDDYIISIGLSDSVPNATQDEKDILSKTKDIYVVRSRTTVQLDKYSFQYTYGDKISNPVENDTLIIDGAMGKTSIQYDWYRTKHKEEVEDGTAKSLGETFPSKETLEGSMPAGWDGAVAGDYVLKVSVKGNKFATDGVGYREINVARKDVTVKIPNEPHKTYGTKDGDAPIEYQVTGLVKWPLEPKEGEEQTEDTLVGALSRERDKTNLKDGVQGPDEWDKVGSYQIEKGTLDEQSNPNYKITLEGNYVYTIDPKPLTWGMSNLIVAQQDNRYKVYGGLTLNGLEEPDNGKVGVTYEKLSINEDGTILQVVEPKLINVNDAVDINYAMNYNPPTNNEVSILDSVYHLKVTEGGTNHLSDAMKALNKTTVGIDSEMSAAVKALRAEQLNFKADDMFRIYDVMVTKDDVVVDDIFQKGGLIVTIPYPEGTSSTTHKFVATHMITSEIAGAKSPGTIERFAGSEDRGELYKLEQTAEGITIKTTGLSPIAIAWAPINSGTNPSDPDDPNNPNNPNNPDDPNNGNNGNNGTNNGNNGTNNGNNGTNNGNNGTNSGTNGTNNGNNNGTNSNTNNNGTNGTNNNSGTNGTGNNSTGTTNNTNKTGTGTTTTKTTSAKTGDTAQIAFYMIATLVACLLLILIIVLIRIQFRKKD